MWFETVDPSVPFKLVGSECITLHCMTRGGSVGSECFILHCMTRDGPWGSRIRESCLSINSGVHINADPN